MGRPAIAVGIVVALVTLVSSDLARATDQLTSSARSSYYGVSIGERGAEVYARLGGPALNITTSHGPTWAYHIEHDNAWLVVLLQHGLVASVNVLGQAGGKPLLNDGFGVNVGDPASKLIAVRGAPSGFVEPNIYYYEAIGRASWMYGIRLGVVRSIGITSGETNIPALIVDWRRDGARPDRAILLHPKRGESLAAQELANLDNSICGGLGPWQILEQHGILYLSEHIQSVRVGCSGSAMHTTFYFKVVI